MVYGRIYQTIDNVRAAVSEFFQRLALGYRVTARLLRRTWSQTEERVPWPKWPLSGYSSVSGTSSASPSNALRIPVWPAASHPRAVQDRNHHRRFNFANLDHRRHRRSIDQSSDRCSDRRLELG